MAINVPAALENRSESRQLTAIADHVRDYIEHSKAENTVRGYRADWEHFMEWCALHGFASLPAAPDCVALYLSDLSLTHKASTLTRRLSAISQAHQIGGYDSPTKAAHVRFVMAGIRRTKGTAATSKAPVLVEDLKRMIDTLPDNLRGVRDRALLLLGFCAGFRRSEIVGLDRRDVEITREGIVITLQRSKTDQEAAGRRIGIPYGANPATCPVRSLVDWLDESGISEGPLFRRVTRHGTIISARLSAYAVALIVKRYASAIGFDVRRFAGHSLRSGLATSAAAAGASERSIMNQTGHKSLTTVRRYIRNGSLFRENAAAVLGL